MHRQAIDQNQFCPHLGIPDESFVALPSITTVFEEVLGCSNCTADCIALCLNQFIGLRSLNSLVLAHRVKDSLSSNSQCVNRSGVFFFKPESYCSLKVAARYCATAKYEKPRKVRIIRRNAHASLFSTTYAVPFGVSAYMVPLLGTKAEISIIPASTSVFA